MFTLLDSAPLEPYGCCICRSGGGKNQQILDLMQEFSPMQLRLYLCKIHCREVAQACGYAKGERMAELDRAAEQITEFEKERDEAVEAAHKMAEELTRVQALNTALEQVADEMRQQRDQSIFGLKQSGARINEALVAANGG